MANAEFSGDIDKVLRSVNSRILISTPKGNVQGFVISEFSLSGQNSFTNLFGARSQEIASDAIRTITSIVNRIQGKGGKIAQRKLEAIDSTIHSWVGSQRPSMNLSMIFVAIRERDDVRESVKTLMRTVYPTEEGIFMVAPLGYSATREGTGTISIQIGKWLLINFLVVMSVNATFSQQVVKLSDGSTRPLYARVEMTVEPHRLPSIDDIEGYFL